MRKPDCKDIPRFELCFEDLAQRIKNNLQVSGISIAVSPQLHNHCAIPGKIPVIGIMGRFCPESLYLFYLGSKWRNDTVFLYVFPGLDGNLFIHRQDPGRGLFTRNFARLQDETIFLYRSSKPQPLNLVHNYFGWPHLPEPVEKWAFSPASAEEMSENKLLNKELCERYRLLTADWVMLDNTDIDATAEIVEKFAGSLESSSLVVKPVTGSGAWGVRYFKKNDLYQLITYANIFLKQGEKLILEEAITPVVIKNGDDVFKNSKLRCWVYRDGNSFKTGGILVQAVAGADSPVGAQYNAVTLSWDKTVFPVNINKDNLRAQVEIVAAAAAGGFAQQLIEAGLAEHIPPIVAVDIMAGEKGVYVLELDTGGIEFLDKTGAAQVCSGEGIDQDTARVLEIMKQRAASNDESSTDHVLINFSDLSTISPGNNYDTVWSFIVEMLLLGECTREAGQVIDSGLKIFPRSRPLWYYSAVVAMQKGDVQQFRRSIETVLKLDPGHPGAYYLLSLVVTDMKGNSQP